MKRVYLYIEIPYIRVYLTPDTRYMLCDGRWLEIRTQDRVWRITYHDSGKSTLVRYRIDARETVRLSETKYDTCGRARYHRTYQNDLLHTQTSYNVSRNGRSGRLVFTAATRYTEFVADEA